MIDKYIFHFSLFTFHFSLLDTDEEYLAAAEKMAKNIKTFTPNSLDDFLFNEVDDLSALPATLDKILENIARVREVPKEKRTYEF